MSIELVTTFCTGIVSIITAIGVILIALKNGKDTKELKEDAVKKDEKLEEIHVLVNSRLTKALDEITLLRECVTPSVINAQPRLKKGPA